MIVSDVWSIVEIALMGTVIGFVKKTTLYTNNWKTFLEITLFLMHDMLTQTLTLGQMLNTIFTRTLNFNYLVQIILIIIMYIN